MTPTDWVILYCVLAGLVTCVWARLAEGKPLELFAYLFLFTVGGALLPAYGLIKLGSIKL